MVNTDVQDITQEVLVRCQILEVMDLKVLLAEVVLEEGDLV